MRTNLPDEQGWYWAKDKDANWYMVFVDTADEEVCFWDERKPFHDPFVCDFNGPQLGGVVAWYGPFNCPGGDFGGHTVVASETDHKTAAKKKRVIGIQHFDFRYCRDEGHGSSLTITGLYDRDEADARIQREVNEEAGRRGRRRGQGTD